MGDQVPMSFGDVSAPPLPEQLADFPTYGLAAGSVVVRIYRHVGGRSPLYYGGVSDHSGRFDPPPGVTDFGTLYAADNEDGSFAETLGRERHGQPISQTEIIARSVAALRTRADIRLADFTDRSIVGRFKLTASASAGADRDTIAACQRWAAALWSAGFSGVRYRARHDPSLRSMSYAVFSSPGEDDDANGPLEIAASLPLAMSTVTRLGREFGFAVEPPAAI